MSEKLIKFTAILMVLVLLAGCQPQATPTPTATTAMPTVEVTPTAAPQPTTYLGETPPGATPTVFRPGAVSGAAIELSLAVHPNLQTLYFTRLESGRATIMVSRQNAAGWTLPEPASFSGEYDDVSPFVAADGQRLYFASKRPSAGSATPNAEYHIWVVEANGAGDSGDSWSDPTQLAFPLESAAGETSPSLTQDGTLYFMADYPALGGAGLYRARFTNDAMETIERLDVLTNSDAIVDVEPFIAPDGSCVLFYSAGRPDNLTPNGRTGDLYIACQNDDGQWSAPRNLGAAINSEAEESTPTLSPDGKYLFFASNRGAGQRFPDLYWMEVDFLQALHPAASGLQRAILHHDALLHGFPFTGPVDESELMPPATAAPPAHRFEGRLELRGERENGHIALVRGALEPAHAYLPEFDFAFVQSAADDLIPAQRGQIIAAHPLWNLILEPGRIWQEPGDNGLSRASLPFALITKGGNAAFNGTLTFLFDGETVSKVWYQVTQETTTHVRANLWGLLDAVYHPGPVANAAQLQADFAAESAARLPTRPLAALAEDYPGVDISAFGHDVTPEHRTWYGVVVNGVNYLGECQTRFGAYPYCESMRATSYSTAKSAFVSVALLRLAQQYGPEVTELLIKDYVPEYAASAGDWERVTFNHALDMATGNYVSDRFMADDNSEQMGEFYGAQPYAARIAAAFTAPHVAAPGARWVYRTSDTFILTRALHNYLQTQAGADADIYQFVVDEVYRPLGLGPGAFTTMRTADNNWQGQAEGGYGTWWIPDDIAKIAMLLNNHAGQINGAQILHPELLTATLQRDPDDRGVRIDSRQMYNNAFWGTRYTQAQGFACEFWVTEMQGVSGNVVALFPNGVTYYYFSDNREFTWDAALREADKIAPLCP